MYELPDRQRIERMKHDDHYVAGDGCQYETAMDLVTGELGFCGCGMPDEAGERVLSALKLIDDKEIEYNDRLQRWAELGFGDEAVRFIFLYWLDDRGLTQHGGSVVGGWLTSAGLQLVSDLEYAIREIPDDP